MKASFLFILMFFVACGYIETKSLNDLSHLLLAQEEACTESRTANGIDCNLEDPCGHPKYRTFDGTCNNLNHPNWGSSNVPFKRLLSPLYEDGKNTPVSWRDSLGTSFEFTKPNPMEVSEIMQEKNVIGVRNHKYTDLLIMWGLFFDHDIHFTSSSDNECPSKCKKAAPTCFPITKVAGERLSPNDCIPMTRSARVCNYNLDSMREQLNEFTSFIDASNVYGSTKQRADEIRDFNGESGFLKVGEVARAGDQMIKYLIPLTTKSQIQECAHVKHGGHKSKSPCFLTGDLRANEHLGLISLDTIWKREHNRIAAALKDINPHWQGNKLYKETRKIIGALIQHITYEQWLPKVVGIKGMKWLSDYRGHDSSVDASVTNVFATAAFRFGHSFLDSQVMGDYSGYHDPCPFCPKLKWNIDHVLRDYYKTPKTEDTQDFRDLRVRVRAMDIQRGRDHGLPGYNAWREFCSEFISKDDYFFGSTPAKAFDDLADEITDVDMRATLQLLYGHPSNVDLVVAGMAEDHLDGGLLGPTFTCLVVEQMRRLRDGDRFWYESLDVFTSNQLKEIKKHSMSRVLCDSGDVQDVPEDVFTETPFPGDYKPCSQISSMNLLAWKDNDNIRSGCEP